MNDAREVRPTTLDPGSCPHRRIIRIGIQRSPIPPRRLYLVNCADCGTTVTTISLRRFFEERDARGPDDRDRMAG